jgi:hypothetical protein
MPAPSADPLVRDEFFGTYASRSALYVSGPPNLKHHPVFPSQPALVDK